MASLATEQESRDTYISNYVIQASTKQDMSFSGKAYDNSFDYVIAVDNHGRLNNRFMLMDIFELMDWSTFLLNENWKQLLIEKTCSDDSADVGCTFTIIKIYPDKFVIDWIGDSSGKIYDIDEKKELWRTKDHDYNNKEDVENLIKEGFWVKIGWDVIVKDSSTVVSVKSKTLKKNNEGLNMTRSLGHSGIFASSLMNFDSETIERNPEKNYKVIVGTDGLWQMTCKDDIEYLSSKEHDASDISEFALSRWKQSWNWDNSKGTITKDIKFPDHNIDDIGVAIWMN